MRGLPTKCHCHDRFVYIHQALTDIGHCHDRFVYISPGHLRALAIAMTVSPIKVRDVAWESFILDSRGVGFASEQTERGSKSKVLYILLSHTRTRS
jgi:hypothetical protein